jgi:N-acyl-L-homoserine lactone synthetase
LTVAVEKRNGIGWFRRAIGPALVLVVLAGALTLLHHELQDFHFKEVKASLRLLPTTGPTVLADNFSDTLPDAARLTAPTIWECTRFCVDDRLLDTDHRDELLRASGELVTGLGEVAIAAGIESILANFDATMLRVYRRIGCEVDVLGCTRRFGRPVYLGLFPISEPILRKVRERLKIAQLAAAGAADRRELVG